MDETLERLKAGIRKFRAEVYGPNAEAYRAAGSHKQTPHALIIACGDSRVDVESITSSGPGDVFVVRNIGNMAPPYGPNTGGVSAAIEYAVAGVRVRHIVVCGHSDCGAMKALMNPTSVSAMPTVGAWLSNGDAALRVAEILQKKDGRDLLTVLTEQNVLLQLSHLKTHPSVAAAIASGTLTLSGWVYEIGSGEVRVAEDSSGPFVAVTEARGGAARHG